jgi:hypothetical protein
MERGSKAIQNMHYNTHHTFGMTLDFSQRVQTARFLLISFCIGLVENVVQPIHFSLEKKSQQGKP